MNQVSRSEPRAEGPTAGSTNAGPRIGPISVAVGASAATVYAMMTTFEGGDEIAMNATNGGDIGLGTDEHIREFRTVVSLPLGFRRDVRTREAIRLLPPNAIQFRHLAGPVRGLAEVISVEALGEARCRVTYDSVLPGSGLLLRIAYRILARPAIERIVRSHLADLVTQAEAEKPGIGR